MPSLDIFNAIGRPTFDRSPTVWTGARARLHRTREPGRSS